MNKKVGIITVCYNAEREIERTIESVVCQSYKDYQYLIIDGASTDSTIMHAEKYESIFAGKGIEYKIQSEPDQGIYDAMNKGILLSDAQWIIFMNAGDCFEGEDTLKNIFEKDTGDCDVIYGDTIFKDGIYYRKEKCRVIDDILKTMPFCHQSVFTRRDTLLKYQFDTQYHIASDYNLFLKIYLDGGKFTYVNECVAIFERNGLSELKRDDMQTQFNQIQKDNCVIEKIGIKQKMYCWWMRTILNIRDFGKRIVPKLYYSPKRGWYKKGI